MTKTNTRRQSSKTKKPKNGTSRDAQRVASLRAEVKRLRVGRQRGSPALELYSQLLQNPRSGPLIGLPVRDAAVIGFGRTVNLSKSIVMRRMCTVTLPIAANSSSQFYFPLLITSGVGAYRGAVAGVGNATGGTAVGGAIPSPSYGRVIAGEVRITNVSRQDDISGRVYFWPEANNHGATNAEGPALDELLGGASSLPADIIADRIVAPTSWVADRATHSVSLIPHSEWCLVGTTQSDVGYSGAPAGELWSTGSPNPGFVLDLACTGSVANTYEVEIVAVIEYYNQTHDHIATVTPHHANAEAAVHTVRTAALTSGKLLGKAVDKGGAFLHKLGSIFAGAAGAVTNAKALKSAWSGAKSTVMSIEEVVEPLMLTM